MAVLLDITAGRILMRFKYKEAFVPDLYLTTATFCSVNELFWLIMSGVKSETSDTIIVTNEHAYESDK